MADKVISLSWLLLLLTLMMPLTYFEGRPFRRSCGIHRETAHRTPKSVIRGKRPTCGTCRATDCEFRDR